MKIVTDWFEKTFKAENQTKFLDVPPKEMKKPFTKDEVRIGNNMVRVFTTTIGVQQGDCLSPVLFTIYLAKALRGEITDHTYARPITYDEMIAPHIIDHTY